MMALGFGVLRLSPRDFWRLSLPELRAAIEGLYGIDERPLPPRRADLAALMRRYPDPPRDLTERSPHA